MLINNCERRKSDRQARIHYNEKRKQSNKDMIQRSEKEMEQKKKESKR
jgi:hypothetical protein